MSTATTTSSPVKKTSSTGASLAVTMSQPVSPDPEAASSTDDDGSDIGRIAHRLAGAVYGTILATTVVVSVQGHDDPVRTAIAIVLVTSMVFYSAHVYSRVIARRMVVRHRLGWPVVIQIARDEWPMLQSSVVVLVPLALGLFGVVDPTEALWLAMASGVAALFTYGIVIGVREDGGWRHITLSALTTGSFGLVILALKVFVH